MRIASVVSVVCLLAGLVLSPSPARAGGAGPRLDGDFTVIDDVAPGDFDVEIRLDDTVFHVDGVALGLGTDGDQVEIRFFTPTPTTVSANDVKGRVRQNRFSQITLFIDSAFGRSEDDTFTPEKCDVDATVNVSKETGKVTVKCSSDTLWAGLTAEQLATIQAAFAENPRVKIKSSASNPTKGSISITIKGVGFAN